jgi:hypothetical protein
MAPEFTERTAVLSEYLRSDQWPCVVEDRTKEQSRWVAEKLLPDLAADLQRAVRVMTAATIEEDGSNNQPARDIVLEYYIKSKTFATLRVLMSFWLHDEPLPDWGEHYRNLAHLWGNRVINGLTWITNEQYSWTFWTDADFYVGGKNDRQNRIRIFVPQMFGRGLDDIKTLNKEDCWRLLLPQILSDETKDVSYYEIHRLLSISGADLWELLTVRGEVMIETESHNSGTVSADARATRIVAERIAQKLKALPLDERQRALFRYTATGILKDLWEKVIDLVPELRR